MATNPHHPADSSRFADGLERLQLPTIPEAQLALKELESNVLKALQRYEAEFGVKVSKVTLSHSLSMGHPRRVFSVLIDCEL